MWAWEWLLSQKDKLIGTGMRQEAPNASRLMNTVNFYSVPLQHGGMRRSSWKRSRNSILGRGVISAYISTDAKSGCQIRHSDT